MYSKKYFKLNFLKIDPSCINKCFLVTTLLAYSAPCISTDINKSYLWILKGVKIVYLYIRWSKETKSENVKILGYYTNVHSNITHNSLKVEIPKMSIN